jgi:beta-lactamase regulating signal transducer with metallopeptidase domain
MLELLDSVWVVWHVRAMLVLVVVLLAALALRGCGERARHRVLSWGLLAAVVLPTVAALAPWGVSVGTPRTPDPVVATSAMPVEGAGAAFTSGPLTAAAPVSAVDMGTVALGVWIVGAAVGLASVVGAAAGSWSLRRGATKAPPEVVSLFEALQAKVNTSARLGVSARIGGPIVVGLLQPTVLLPPDASSWSRERLEAVLGHELGHVIQGDARWFPLAHAVRGALWLNPLAWVAARAMFRAAEFSADEAAAAGSLGAPRYAAQLLSLANSGVSPHVPPLAAAALGRPDVGTRIRRLLAERRAVARLRRIVPVTAGLLGATLCVVLARPATVQPLDVAQAHNLQPVPAHAVHVSLRGGGLQARTDDGARWSQSSAADLRRESHLLVDLHAFLAEHGLGSRPLVVDADRDTSFAALVDVLYTAGRAGITRYYLQVEIDGGPKVVSVSPPRYGAAGQTASLRPRVGVVVGEQHVGLASWSSSDADMACRVPASDAAAQRRAAAGLCGASGGNPIEVTYTPVLTTPYGVLIDTLVATALPCGGTQIIEANGRTHEAQARPDCDAALSGARITAVSSRESTY